MTDFVASLSGTGEGQIKGTRKKTVQAPEAGLWGSLSEEGKVSGPSGPLETVQD